MLWPACGKGVAQLPAFAFCIRILHSHSAFAFCIRTPRMHASTQHGSLQQRAKAGSRRVVLHAAGETIGGTEREREREGQIVGGIGEIV